MSTFSEKEQKMSLPEKQVDKTHYQFSTYMHKERWISIWHQLHEVINLNPENILEIGPGSGIFQKTAKAFGLNIQTLDIDSDLSPDYIGTADAIPIESDKFDVVCAFQVLEHMPFEKSKEALREMARVAKKSVIISLPDVTTSCGIIYKYSKNWKEKFCYSKIWIST